MAKFISATTPDAPGFLEVARGVYADAFASASRPDLEDAVGEWSDLTPAEQGFATAHLLYLSIEAQAATQSLLEDVRDALEDLQVNAEQATGVIQPTPPPLASVEAFPEEELNELVELDLDLDLDEDEELEDEFPDDEDLDEPA